MSPAVSVEDLAHALAVGQVRAAEESIPRLISTGYSEAEATEALVRSYLLASTYLAIQRGWSNEQSHAYIERLQRRLAEGHPQLSIVEAAKIGERLNKRWPGYVIVRRDGRRPHEIRTAAGEVIASHEDLGECMRQADEKAQQKEAR